MSEDLINAPEMEAQNEEQVVEQPVQEEINVETPAEVVEETIAEEIIEEIPAPEVVEEPVAEEIIEEIPAPEVVEEPIVEEPIAVEPVAEEPVAEEPVAVEPVAEVITEPLSTEAPLVAAEIVEEIPVKKHIVLENVYDSLENFNWDNLEKKGSKYSAAEKERYAELYTKSFKSIDENEVIKGTVVSINMREIVVNIGFKSDGVITASELRYKPDLKIGDDIEVYVENQEDATGQLQLSHKKARLLQSWNRVNKAFEDSEIITGYVK
jgi:small subunit ribosomal protein S1